MNPLAFRADKSYAGVWFSDPDRGRIFVVRCHLCETWVIAGYEREMVDKVGLEAAQEWIEYNIKHNWNEDSPCKHIKFDISVGVKLQDVWLEWGRGQTGTLQT